MGRSRPPITHPGKAPAIATTVLATEPIPAAPIDWSVATMLPRVTVAPYVLIIHAAILPPVIPVAPNPRAPTTSGAALTASAPPTTAPTSFLENNHLEKILVASILLDYNNYLRQTRKAD